MIIINRELLGETLLLMVYHNNNNNNNNNNYYYYYYYSVGRNICHGSDSVESAEREIK